MALVQATLATDGRQVAVPEGWVKLWPDLYLMPDAASQGDADASPDTTPATADDEPTPTTAKASRKTKREEA